MPLKRTGSLTVAQTILDLLDKDERLEKYHDSEDIVVGTFRNGREHGFVIAVSPTMETKHIFFSQNRSSDDIVVYHGKSVTLDDKVYESRKYFGDSDSKSALGYIVSLIIKYANCTEESITRKI
jgi:hypothetical protein